MNDERKIGYLTGSKIVHRCTQINTDKIKESVSICVNLWTNQAKFQKCQVAGTKDEGRI